MRRINFVQLIILLFLFHFPAFLFSQAPVLDSLENILNSTKADTIRVKISNQLGWEYLMNGDTEKALKYTQNSVDLAKKIKFPKGEAAAYNNLGSIYWSQGEYNKALQNYKKAYDIAYLMGDQTKQSSFLGNMGMIYILQSDYMNALDVYHKALKMDEKLGNTKAIVKNFGSIGTIYKELNDYEKSLEYCLKALELAEKINDINGKASNYGNIGNVYMEKKEYKKALDYYQKALVLEKELDDKYGMAGEMTNIGSVYSSMAEVSAVNDKAGMFHLALEYFNQSNLIAKSLNLKNIEAFNQHAIASIHLNQGKLSKAYGLINSAITLQEEMEAIYYLKDSYLTRSKIDSALGNYKDAYSNYKKHKYWEAMVASEDNKKAKIQKHIQYEYEKKATADSVRSAKEKEVSDAKIMTQKAQIEQEKTKSYSLYGGLALLFVFGGFMYNRYRITRKQNIYIEAQKKEVEIQKQIVETAHHSLEEKNKEVIDSINYAKRIQDALLKSEEHESKHLPEHFIFYKPKDIVSGDFYWSLEKDNHLYLAAADCTGHGVPGAFLTLLGTSFLNEINAHDKLLTPSQILDELRNRFIKELNQTGAEGESKDGMDISLVRINLKNFETTSDQNNPKDELELQFAGANNPLYLIKGKEFHEIKGDKQPIGYHNVMKPFTNHIIQLKNKDNFYIFTDGFPDQFGGPKGKKLMYKMMKEILNSICHKSMEEQKMTLNNSFNNWKGDLEQVDDVCVIGVRV
ncbi:MAG: tetratricopeptide repeat protein [Bacteroidota bacterium]|nr:tetratricopeptide repeat protein [Bacteroidota bacterium]